MTKSLMTSLIAVQTSAMAVSFHVVPSGDDANPGSAQHPFVTIARAQREARQVIAAGLKEDLVVHLHPGVYVLSEPVRFDPRDSGTARHAVIYRALGEERATLMAGRRLTGAWLQQGNGMWVSQIPGVAAGEFWFRDLWHDGQRLTFCNREQWSTRSWTLSVTEPSFTADRGRLKVPGDWALNRPSGSLYYMQGHSAEPPAGEFVAGGISTPIEVAGEKDRPVTNLRIEGICLQYTGWNLPEWGYHGLWGGVYQGRGFDGRGPDAAKRWNAVDAAVEVEFADGVRLSELRLEHLGGMGIAFGRGVRNSVIEGCLIADTGSTGVYEGWQGNAPRKAVDGWSNEVGRPCRVGPKIPNLDLQWGEPDVYPRNNQIRDNHIRDVGMTYDAMGILCNGVWNPHVEHNYVLRTSYCTISINDCTGDGPDTKVLRNNHMALAQMGVRGSGMEDGASLYTSNSNVGLLIEGNYVRDGAGNVSGV